MAEPRFLVTGPGCEGRRSPAAGPALSLALTLASRLGEEGSFYVRSPEGACLHRVDREPDGLIRVRSA